MKNSSSASVSPVNLPPACRRACAAVLPAAHHPVGFECPGPLLLRCRLSPSALRSLRYPKLLPSHNPSIRQLGSPCRRARAPSAASASGPSSSSLQPSVPPPPAAAAGRAIIFAQDNFCPL
eukprot:scaffold4892_cov119-Isochrysis_galbana.AAC.4